MKVEQKQDIELIQKSIAVEFGLEKEQKDERYSKVVVLGGVKWKRNYLEKDIME